MGFRGVNEATEPSEDFSYLVGLTVTEATAVAAEKGDRIRVRFMDGSALIGTSDYRLDRINVAVTGAKISSVVGRG